MKYVSLGLVGVLVMCLPSCGGGGTPPPPVLQPLITNVITDTPATISYSITGTAVSNLSGSVPVTGSGATYSCNGLTVGGTLSGCIETTETYAPPAGSGLPSITRSYSVRHLPTGTIMQTGSMLSDGATIAWDNRPLTGPLNYLVGFGFANTGTRTGFLNNTTTARLTQTENRWNVDAIDDVQTPAGWFECYVVSSTIVGADLLTGIARTCVSTSYVRPEFGVVFAMISLTTTDGAEVVTRTVKLTATSIVP